MQFDLLIKGGTVIDPANRINDKRDVAIKRNRIAAVATDIPASAAARVIDASGQYVTPGLVDLHTHVYYGATFWGINPDPVAARSGVTTWLDVGSAGAYNWPGFRRFVIQNAQSRIYGLLNISTIGLTAPTWELANLNYCDVDMACKMVDLNRDLLIGIKARVDSSTTGHAMGAGTGVAGLQRARAAADRLGLPVMVHIAAGPPSLSEILPIMRPGDIVTHCCTGRDNRLVTETGKMREMVRLSREEGLIFDVGHGAGSFSFASAEQMLADGFIPDVISTDIHQLAINGPCFDMPTTLSKFMALGMSLYDVIERASVRPAQVMGVADEIGTLKPGALADVALFKLADGDFTLYDIDMLPRTAKQLLVNTQTILNGRSMQRTCDEPMMPWIELDEGQRALVSRGHTPQAMCACC